ncbi:MAG TPA: flagellar motor switch protein FliM [Fimbriimonadaceae bacterium]|nr:flagellar motor switch protein FliM [Fimbriimonadaceae bacterium]
MRARKVEVSEILSQSEIEALLNSLSTESDNAPQTAGASAAGKGGPGRAPAAPAPGSSKRPGLTQTISYEVYDFRRPDKFSKDQLRTLQMLHETFARLSGSALSAYLRAPVNIDLISLEQVPYEEYLRSIQQSVFAIISLPPLTGQAVLEIEFGLVFTMIDRLLGGPGRSVNRIVLTDIERPLVRQTIEKMLHALKSAWEGVVIVNPGIEGLETSSQFVQIAPPNDIVVTILFEVKIGQQRSAMSLCIPYLVLKPITAKLSAQKWFANGNRRQSSASRRLLSQQVSNSMVECTVCLGETKIKVKDFLSLQPGDILQLNRRTDEDLTLLVGDIPKFEGKPAMNGKKVVFSVTDPIQE